MKLNLNKSFFFLFLISLPIFSQEKGEELSSFEKRNVLTAPIYVANALFRIKKGEAKQANTISGKCEYKGSSCNGAKVSLYLDGEVLKTLTLTQDGEFHFPDLKLDDYEVEINFSAHKVREKTKARPGDFVQLALSLRK